MFSIFPNKDNGSQNIFEVIKNSFAGQNFGLPQGGPPQTNTPTPEGFVYQDPVQQLSGLKRLALMLSGGSSVDSFRNTALQNQLAEYNSRVNADEQAFDRSMREEDLGLRKSEMQMRQDKLAQETTNRSALKDIASKVASGEMTRDNALVNYAMLTGDASKLFQADTTPASIKEYNFVNQLDPEQRQLYFQNKRANQMFDRGGSQVIMSPEGQVVQEIQKTLSPEQRPEVRGAQAAASAEGAIRGEEAANRAKSLEGTNEMLATIDAILADEEGLEASTGGFLGMQGRQAKAVPLTEAQRRMQPIINQLQGQTFLTAYESLKGGGQITEVEGAKAESAKARLDQAQTPDDFRKALTDLREVVMTAQKRIQGGGSTTQSSGGSLEGLSTEELMKMLGE